MDQFIKGNNNVVIGGSLYSSGKGNGNTVKGNGKVKSEVRNLPSFNKIKLKGSIHVVYSTETKSLPIKVMADSNLLDLVSTKVKNDTLIVKTKGGFSTRNKIVVECSSSLLNTIVLDGSGDIEASHIAVDNLEVFLNGSGDIKVDGKCKYLTVNLEGSGDIKVDGKCDNLTVSLEGSGDIDCRKLEGKTGSISLFGSGDIRAVLKKSVECRLVGSGDIKVTGNPDEVLKSKNGSGSIKVK